MKKLLVLTLTAAMLLTTACSSETASSAPAAGDSNATGESTTSTAEADPIKVGVILSTGGLGDQNFNDMTYAGVLRAQEEFGIEFDYVEPTTSSDFIPNYRMFAETEEYDLILGLAYDQREAVLEVSADFPEQKFSLIDDSLEHPNVSTVSTKWTEQTFLTGVIAGLATQSDVAKTNDDNVIGVVLGMESPVLRQGIIGYTAGAMYVNPEVEVLEATVDNFNDPAKGKEIALSMYNRGADFVQHIAGASGMGVFTAAKEADLYAFGVGGNQNHIEPDYIAATAIRNVDEIVYNEIKSFVEGTWAEGSKVSGLKEGSVGYSVEGSNIVLPEDMIAIVEEIRQQIVDGTLVPPTTAEELEAWVAANQYQQ